MNVPRIWIIVLMDVSILKDPTIVHVLVDIN